MITIGLVGGANNDVIQSVYEVILVLYPGDLEMLSQYVQF